VRLLARRVGSDEPRGDRAVRAQRGLEPVLAARGDPPAEQGPRTRAVRPAVESQVRSRRYGPPARSRQAGAPARATPPQAQDSLTALDAPVPGRERPRASEIGRVPPATDRTREGVLGDAPRLAPACGHRDLLYRARRLAA